MASEDVLERADHTIIAYMRSAGQLVAAELVTDLAAEVRELRKDQERFAWLLSSGPLDVNLGGGDWTTVECVEDIDAAMGEANGE